MRVVVQDANVIFDLIDCDIFELFFQLDFEVVTTSLVLREISDAEQLRACQGAVDADGLEVIEISTIEYLRLQALDLPGLKVADRSVLRIAEDRKAFLLTGDGRLRKTAKSINVTVCGTLWVFDQLIASELLTYAEARAKLTHLREINPRLPQAEIEKRLLAWSEQG